eukprot:c32519_g1_i1.p1 GENE.c32519_g1_i1~~c32519_g1_i1.p1  ORF type:complete len:347 (+),score=87.99 c32519_g1_i1:27-1043(+)
MNTLVGLVACLIAGFFFGSNFIPVKKFEVGDGAFFQWVMCVGIWCVGLITIAFDDNGMKFHPFTMLGGALWCTGNFLCVHVIKLVGMSMGLMVWGITNSLAGWASGKFGLFGLNKEEIARPGMNYAGLILTICSLALFAWVKTTVGPSKSKNFSEKAYTEQLLDGENAARANEFANDWTRRVPPHLRQAIGFVLACTCGLFFGFNFVPPLHEQANGGPKKNLDYVFSHFCGIFMTSTIFMLLYCIATRNKPWISAEIVLPAFASGVMWAIAQVSWFIAIQELQMVVANPIVTSLPSIVAGFWGIVLFKEIQGATNLALFGGGLLIAIIGVVLVAISAS